MVADMTALRASSFRAGPCLLLLAALANTSCADTDPAPADASVARADGGRPDAGRDASVQLDAALPRLDAAAPRLDAAAVQLDGASISDDALFPRTDGSQVRPSASWEDDASAGSCPASSALELAITYEGGELSSAGWYFSHRHGVPLFLLDLQGRFVVSVGSVAGFRQGQLSPHELDALRAALHLTNLPSWPTRSPPGGGVFANLVIRTKDNTFSCDECKVEGTAESAAVAAMLPDLLARLADSSGPLTGPLSVAILDRNIRQQPEDQPWPLAWSPAAIAVGIDHQMDIRERARTVVGDDASKLRAMREARTAMLGYDVGGIAVTYDEESMIAWLQDELPVCLAASVARWDLPR